MRDTTEAVAVLNGTQATCNEVVTDAVQARIRELVTQIKHANRIKATTRLERSKNELRSIVKLYGIGVMNEVYSLHGFTSTAVFEESKAH